MTRGMSRLIWIAALICADAYNRQRELAKVLMNSSDRLVRSHRPSASGSMQVRLSLLRPSNDSDLVGSQGPFLRNALCWAEKNLASALVASSFGVAPEYLVYTDRHTHAYAQEIFQGFPWHRYKLVNLDEDPLDAERMAPFDSQDFDAKNWASVRRTLADCDHLSTRRPRLLLGTDVKFLQRPVDFIQAASELGDQQAIYMVDRFWQGETPDGQPVSNVRYRMNRSGPQCAGLLGDFVFLSPGVTLTVEQLQEKMQWYMKQPRTLQRTIPACPASCMASHGLHAIDQFALVMALGEAVRPPELGCFALDAEKYSHWYPRTPKTQVTHDKSLDSCILEAKDLSEEEAKLKMVGAATVLLSTAVASLFCAFSEKGGDNLDDWKALCSS